MTANELQRALHAAFDYTTDNNRDLLHDEVFPMSEVTEELEVERSYQFLCAYIERNRRMIDTNLEEENE